MFLRVILVGGLLALGSVENTAAAPAPGSPPPPSTYRDEANNRYITLEWIEGGKVNVNLRTGSMGSYGRWAGRGEQTPKGIVFSQLADENASTTEYIASGGGAKLTVKLKPGQKDAQDAGLSGVYVHISEEKVTSLLKKDAQDAEKRLDEAIRAASKKAPADDKAAYVEFKKRWPELRERLINAYNSRDNDKPKKNPDDRPKAPTTKPATVGNDKTAAQWMRQAEVTITAANFISPGVPAGLQPGWEGIYDDGFGGTVDLHIQKIGALKFELNCGRADGAYNGTFEHKVMPGPRLKEGKDSKEATAEFIDDNPEVKDSPQTQIKFHRIGHFVVIETTEAQRYANRGWFDGIYLKRLQRPEE